MPSLSHLDTISKSAPPKERRTGPKPTLLVVDDEEGPRQSVKIIFKEEFNVLLASDGARALDLARQNSVDVAILGLGQGKLKPVVRGDKTEPRLMLPLALSYDHRVIDGGAAARFMVDLVAAFEGFSEADAKV